MRYDFTKMDSDSFETMVRSLNEKIFGMKCDQYGLGPDGQREFTFEGDLTDNAGTRFNGRTIGQVKYKYLTTKTDDYTWLVQEIKSELERFRHQEKKYRPDHYLFFTNVVLTPAKNTGVKDKIDAYVKAENNIIPHFYVKGYDEICAMLDNNRDVATSYAALILPGDILMQLLEKEPDHAEWLKKFLYREFEEDMHTRMEQAGSATEKKISIEKVCVDIDIIDSQSKETIKFAEHILKEGNKILGYRKPGKSSEQDRIDNFVLIGGPGHGKSTICQFIAQIYRMQYLKHINYPSQQLDEFAREIDTQYGYKIKRARIPFKIVLRDYAAWINRRYDTNISIIQYLKERIRKIEGDDISLRTIRKMLENLPWIFFFDGLDEVPESSNRKDVLKQLHIFILELKEHSCDCMMIGTTRSQGYHQDFDEKNYKHVEIANLSKDDCSKYIQRLFEVMEDQTDRREEYIQIMKEALNDETTSRLMKTPLQAAIISILVKSGGRPPQERYALFRQYYDTVIRREKQKGITAFLNDNTNWLDELHYFIGYQLQLESEQKENASAEISLSDLKIMIETYIKENADDFYESETDSKQKADDFLAVMTRRICFLCENRDGFFSFQIRSIQEFFAGTYLVKNKRSQEAMEYIRQICYSAYWRNSLLFAFGYIDAERKDLEPEIGELCRQMNGEDNILKEDFTSENLCLFGSWLAIDILAEDIFHGKRQSKYIVLASKAMSLYNCKAYRNFGQITGTQLDKLLCYAEQNLNTASDEIVKIILLLLKLSQNPKNYLDEKIEDALKKTADKQQIKLCIFILENESRLGYSEAVVKSAAAYAENALEHGRIQTILPDSAIPILIDTCKYKISLPLRRNLFLHCLFANTRHAVKYKLLFKLDIQCDVRSLLAILVPENSYHSFTNITIDITRTSHLILPRIPASKRKLKEMQKTMEALNLLFLSRYFDFLIKPEYAKYQELSCLSDKEDAYLADNYRAILNRYIPPEHASEENFMAAITSRRWDYIKLCKYSFQELFYRETDVTHFYGLTDNNTPVFDELIEHGPVPASKLEALSTDFISSYLFAARTQLYCSKNISDISEKTAENCARLLCEAGRRKYCDVSTLTVTAFLILPRFKNAAAMYQLNSAYISSTLTPRLAKKTLLYIKREYIQTSVLTDIIRSIAIKAAYEANAEDCLSILPLLIKNATDFKKLIPETILTELEQAQFHTETARLAVRLLQICTGSNEQPEAILDDILKSSLPDELIFIELQNMLHFCKVENKENLLVSMYLRLENKTFEDAPYLRLEILNDLIENKCTAAALPAPASLIH